jgi:Cof subfamily protein (haloacid dehalogenase superfamily)
VNLILQYELLVMDLDGTLLDSAFCIPPQNVDAVRSLVSTGVKVVLASGRIEHSMRRFYNELGLDTPIISCNGALVRTLEEEILSHQPLPTNLADEVLDFCIANDIHLNYYHVDVLSCCKDTEWGRRYNLHVREQNVLVRPTEELRGTSPTKLVIVDHPPIIAKLWEEMQERYGDNLYITVSEPQYLELMNPKASKAHGLKVVCEHLGIAPKRTVAIGDSHNDLPMLRSAGLSFAMGNAGEAIQQAADRIAPRNDEAGVAIAIKDVFCLNFA